MLDHELPVKPAAGDTIPIWTIVLQVQRVEFIARLDAVPLVVGEKFDRAVIHHRVKATSQRSLRQAVGCLLVLDVRRAEAQFAVDRLDVKRQVTCRRPMPLRVLGGEEVQEMRMVVSAVPPPTLRELEVEAEIDLVGGLKQTPDARRARCPRVATEPLIFDTAPAGPGVANNSKLGAIVPIPFREIRIVETLAEDHARSCRRPGAGAADKC